MGNVCVYHVASDRFVIFVRSDGIFLMRGPFRPFTDRRTREYVPSLWLDSTFLYVRCIEHRTLHL